MRLQRFQGQTPNVPLDKGLLPIGPYHGTPTPPTLVRMPQWGGVRSLTLHGGVRKTLQDPLSGSIHH